jgi:predicted NBD/HSP70 family sugar kinase
MGRGARSTFSSGTPSLLRALNERTALELIRAMGPVSRAQIARHTGMSKPTVSQALAALESAKLVRGAGRSSGGRGATALLYELNPHAGWVVGIDVGRAWVRAAIANLNGDIVAGRDERTKIKSLASLIAQIGEIAHGLAAEAGIRWRDVTVATVGSPGVVDLSTEQITLAHALPGWGRRGLVGALQRELGTKVEFENDVNLAALGEQWHGLAKEVPNFVYLHVGTGVGAGLVLNGELFRGTTGAAGEIGYFPFSRNGDRDSLSSRRGALDAGAGAGGVVATARALGMKPPLSAKKVFAAARRGDPGARRVVEIEAERIGAAAAAVVSVVDPELLILGGGIGSNGDLLLERVRAEVKALSPMRPRVEVSALGERATLEGAVFIALQAAQERLFSRSRRASAV